MESVPVGRGVISKLTISVITRDPYGAICLQHRAVEMARSNGLGIACKQTQMVATQCVFV